MYELWIGGNRYMTPRGTPVDMYPWQIEGNECWKEVTTEPAGRWVPEYGDNYFCINGFHEVTGTTWYDHEVDDNVFNIGNVYRTEQEAQDEVKRRESIANAWWPEENGCYYVWNYGADGEQIVRSNFVYDNSHIPYAYIGACHKTKEACKAWGKEYAHLFDKRPKHD